MGNGCYYPYTCNPKDVELSDNLSYMVGYGNADVYYRGEYTPKFLSNFHGVDFDEIVSEEDLKIIASSEPDYQSLTYYYSVPVDHKIYNGDPNSCFKDTNPYTKQTEWGWNMEPYGIKHYIEDYYHRYRLPILILENEIGHRDEVLNGKIEDDYRIDYLKNHIERVKEAVEDGTDIIGYLTWSAIDLYSTREGFAKRYGFVYVDKEKDFKRIKKKSFYWYKKVIETNGENLDV